MIVVYAPDTSMIISTVDQPYPPGLADHYTAEGLTWFDAPDAAPGTNMWLPDLYAAKAADGTFSMQPRKPVPYTASATSVAAGGTVTFTGLPNPVSLTVDGGAPQSVAGGTLALTLSDAGSYVLALSAMPYLDATVTVTVS